MEVRMLRNNYKMSNASGCYPVAKSHGITKVCKTSSYKPWWRLRCHLCPTAINARMWLDSPMRHSAFRYPEMRTFRLRFQFIVASQWDGKPVITVHAVFYWAPALPGGAKYCKKYISFQKYRFMPKVSHFLKYYLSVLTKHPFWIMFEITTQL